MLYKTAARPFVLPDLIDADKSFASISHFDPNGSRMLTERYQLVISTQSGF